MLKFCHIADIHFRGWVRHQEYHNATQFLIDDIKTQGGVDHIFVAGDIFHHKTQGLTPEAIDAMAQWFKVLAEVATVHIVLGNHDCIVSNPGRQDAISPIINAINDPRIKLYKNSGVYQIAPGYNFCVYSVTDEKRWSEIAPVPGDVNIATFHGPVRGAKTEVDWEVTDGITTEFFKEKGYDFCFLGDIHKQQFLDTRAGKPWIGYAGSLVQQNYGEELLHGYLLWKIGTRDDFTVEHRTLPNIHPFVTLDWQGSVNATLKLARKHTRKARFRIRHDQHLSHKDVTSLTSELKRSQEALEVVFKSDVVTAALRGTAQKTIQRSDLRKSDVVYGLIKQYHSAAGVDEQTWQRVSEAVQRYSLMAQDDAVLRNISWALRSLKFDNTFAYGENNIINFDALDGVVGVFGPNKLGKSSVLGTILYTLCNTTDRGSAKNLHIINERKKYCSARAHLTLNGDDYVVERQTTKVENKRGDVFAGTVLNLFKLVGNDAVDLSEDGRVDTDKALRRLLGSADDLLLTAMSTQGDVNQIVSTGATKRNHILSRFLDLDVLHKMHDNAKLDLNASKTALKMLPDREWVTEANQKKALLQDADNKIADCTMQLEEIESQLTLLKEALRQHSDVTPVTQQQVDKQRVTVATLEKQHAEAGQRLLSKQALLKKNADSQTSLTKTLIENNIEELKQQITSLRKLETSIVALKHAHSKEVEQLKKQKKSVKVLNTVPCGDQFPTCIFIKDAHIDRENLDAQQQRVKDALSALDEASRALDEAGLTALEEKLAKLEALREHSHKLDREHAALSRECDSLSTEIERLVDRLSSSRAVLSDLTEALENNDNAEVVSLRSKIDAQENKRDQLTRERVSQATQRGKLLKEIEQLVSEKTRRDEVLKEMRVYELISTALSKKAVPCDILMSQLPIINERIAELLNGIVDFSVELERDKDTDDIEIYVVDGTSRRLVELCCGVEKFVSAVAIRAALCAVSTLPKPNIFFIDEGFGACDASGIEACGRLLQSLKKHFKLIFVISHVENIKEYVDQTLEITKVDRDARLVLE